MRTPCSVILSRRSAAEDLQMRCKWLVLRILRSFVVLRFAAATQDDGTTSGEFFTASEPRRRRRTGFLRRSARTYGSFGALRRLRMTELLHVFSSVILSRVDGEGTVASSAAHELTDPSAPYAASG